jgi:uncharacterized glyoxalase superfamily metalloenzyme YdcJ
MSITVHVTADDVRSRFSRAMSEMYRREVPLYGTLQDLVADINATALADAPAQRSQMMRSGELERMDVERHGAIRLGTAAELFNMRRIFAVMGMVPVGYYDLSVAGVPVHSTAFRPIADEALSVNPFRVFTSLLRLDLIADPQLREQAGAILAQRSIFTQRALELTRRFEDGLALGDAQADEFVAELTQTFRWHGEAVVPAQVYKQLHDAHRLIADVVCFSGPHINHLTPRTMDIDAAQCEMLRRGIEAKEVIEGPPPRKHPILLRQTSFKALEESVRFAGDSSAGTHSARFGEIEQRGMALTPKGRVLYDELLVAARQPGATGGDYRARLKTVFAAFPDDLESIRQLGLAFFRYQLSARGEAARGRDVAFESLDELIARELVVATPIVYEDFLPVSAAGIFQSNLGDAEHQMYASNEAKASFERDLGTQVHDEFGLYQAAERRSIEAIRRQLDAPR